MDRMTGRPSSRRFVAMALAGLVVGACALTACGGSGGGATGATPTPADTALLGPDKPTSGAPVKIGFLYDGQSAAIDTTHQVVSARAVVKYANAKLGGIGGHPIQLFECQTHSDPATDCGDQFVAARVIAVIGGQAGEGSQVAIALNKADIPYVDANGPAATFSLTNFLLAIGAPAQYAADNGIKQVAIIVIGLANSVAEINEFAGTLFKNVGVNLDVVGVPVGTADPTPQIEAAEAKHPGLFHLVGNDTFCASALKAIRTLGLQAKVSGINRCLSKAASGAIPGGFAGMTVLSGISLDPAQPETKLYEAFLAAYVPGIVDDDDYQTGYQAMLGFIRGVNAGGITSVTSEGVKAALRKMPVTPLPLGGGLTYSCSGKALPVFPANCSVGAVSSQATADGSQHDFTLLTSTKVYAFGG